MGDSTPAWLREFDRLTGAAGRSLLGIAGPPGAGKSTLAEALRRRACSAPPSPAASGVDAPPARVDEIDHAEREAADVRIVPMDGFHLPHAELERRGLARRKGSPQTFDAAGFVSLLARLRDPSRGGDREPVSYPVYDRRSHEPRFDPSARIEPQTRVVIVEGNYLLLSEPPWERVRPLLDVCWWLEAPVTVLRSRLLARHERGGRTPIEAERHFAKLDLPNVHLLSACASRADRVLPFQEASAFTSSVSCD